MESYIEYGFAITAWAMFERSVDIAVWIAFNIDLNVAPAITDQVQSFRSKLIMIENVVQKKGGSKEDLRRLKQFRNSIEGITRERNRLVHDPHLTTDFGALLAVRGMPEKDIKLNAHFENALKSEIITNDILRDFTKRANQLHDQYVALYSGIFVGIGLGPSDKKPLPEPRPT